MVRIILYIITGIVVSFYFFPFEFRFLPEVNTKMAMAGVGLILCCVQLARKRMPLVDKDFCTLSALAVIVSFIGFASVAYNGTNDYTYVTYFISMWVWMSAAYVAVSLVRKVHGNVSVRIICDYLIAVCVFQCLIAIAMDMYPPLEMAVDSVISGFGFTQEGFVENTDRLYGIGATLDVAGSRFAAVLIIIAYLVVRYGSGMGKWLLSWYVFAFFVIAVIGNMIARTTTVGLVLTAVYVFWSIFRKHSADYSAGKIGFVVSMMALGLFFVILIYNVSPAMKDNMRFAFEGFFSLAETGKWEVHSNEILKNMYVFPDNAKTWLIGDGYMENPYGDPYYVGPQWHGYYMGTDVGYLRFIFYFGIFGLLTFMYFIYKAARICMTRFHEHEILFLFVLAVNFVVWLKVSTDIFLVFALFLCISGEDEEKYAMMLSSGGCEALEDGNDTADMSDAPADIDRK